MGFTERAKSAIGRAAQLATERFQSPTGTVHLLAALLQDEEGFVADVLRKLGANLPLLRKSTDDLPTSETEEAEGSGGYGLVAYRAMQSAIDAAKSLGNSYEGTEHLLLGLATEQSSDAAQVLAAHGITRDRLFEALQAENDSGLEKLMATVLDGADETMPGQCQACGVSPAIVHVTEIKGNTMRGVHLCEECARKHGVGWV